MFNLDNMINENNKEHNEKWPFISRSPEQNFNNWSLWIWKNKCIIEFNKSVGWYWLNLFVYKRFKWTKVWILIKKRENAGIKHFNDAKAFIECSNTMDEVYENIDDYNPNRERKILIECDDMIADIMTNKKVKAIIKDLFITFRKLNISLCLSHNLIFLFQKMSD